jgi:hypothetical protein
MKAEGGSVMPEWLYEDRHGLLEPRHDPESEDEREQEADAERRRWDSERPPHHEAR